jgi:transposase
MEKVLQFVGADLSKKTIDLVIYPTKQHLSIVNSKAGFNQMLKWLKQSNKYLSNIILVMEHTGLYSYCFEKFLFEKGINFSKVNPVDIKYSIGVTRGKSDKVDATRIAKYAAEKQDRLQIQTPTSKGLEELKMLNTSRDKLVRTRASLKTSIEEFRNIGMSDREPALRAQLKIIKSLDKEIKLLDNQIQSTIQQESGLRKTYNLLISITGIGPVVATNVIVKTGNFKRFANSRKFACYCGIAPFEHTSGTSIRGKTRVNHMADKSMKTLLDLAAKAAIRCDPEMRAFFDKRTALGKPKMSTINIVRFKIVGRMFAVVKRQTPYRTRLTEAA